MQPSARSAAVFSAVYALLGSGCGDAPVNQVVFANDYAPSPAAAIVYRASWQTAVLGAPLAPGASSAPIDTIASSDNPVYVVLAPGWDPASPSSPASLVVLQSRAGYALHLDNTLRIPIDDATFAGNCAAGSVLTQAQADFVTGLVFPEDFASRRYDAAHCTTTPIGDAGAPGR